MFPGEKALPFLFRARSRGSIEYAEHSRLYCVFGLFGLDRNENRLGLRHYLVHLVELVFLVDLVELETYEEITIDTHYHDDQNQQALLTLRFH
jgi:hypothetical protein